MTPRTGTRRINTGSSKIFCVLSIPNFVPPLSATKMSNVSSTFDTPLHPPQIDSPEGISPPAEQQNPIQSRDPKAIFAEQVQFYFHRSYPQFLCLLLDINLPKNKPRFLLHMN